MVPTNAPKYIKISLCTQISYMFQPQEVFWASVLFIVDWLGATFMLWK